MTRTRMQVVYSDDGLLHNPSMEMTGGEWKPFVGTCCIFAIQAKQYLKFIGYRIA
jgi:hypothetical protein